MSKFKIGDRVRVVRNQSHTVQDRTRFIGREFTIGRYEQEWEGQPSWSMSPSNPYRWRESELELVLPTGPVRTVTRKEIVPGVYDGVLVGEVVEGCVFVRTGLNDQGKRYDPKELRKVIDVLGQLADALED